MQKISHDSEIPAHGQQVITTCAFIYHVFDGEQKLFLSKRADTKKFLPGVYELPGGHVDFGENIVAGLKREVKEEFGVEIAVGDPFAVFDYINGVKGSHSIEVVYFAQFAEPLENIKLNPEDHSGFEWFAYEDVKDRRKEIVAEEYESHQDGDDPEYVAILRGFELLQGKQINF